MKYPLLIARICLAVVLTLAIGLLPHHHHHGELCWVMDMHGHHHQHDGTSHKDCPPDPCTDSTCYVQVLNTFLQVERTNTVDYGTEMAFLPSQLVLLPDFIYISPTKPNVLRWHSSPTLWKVGQRRGPPIC